MLSQNISILVENILVICITLINCKCLTKNWQALLSKLYLKY